MAAINPHRGEVWWVDLKTDSTGTGTEKPERPAIVVSTDAANALPVKLVVPITGWDETYRDKPWHVKLLPGGAAGLTKLSSADTLGLKTVAKDRFRKKLGRLDAEDTGRIEAALKIVLRLR
jgi:mRNA interferase MazF